MTTGVLTTEKTLLDLIPRTPQFTSGAYWMRNGAVMQYVLMPNEPNVYGIFTCDYGEGGARHYIATKEQYQAAAADQSPLADGDFLQAFTNIDQPSGRTVEGPGAKVVNDELKGHTAADENKLQTKKESELSNPELPLIKQIQDLFNTNGWAQFLKEKSIAALVQTFPPVGEPFIHTTYVAVLDTLVPETILFEKKQIIVLTRDVQATIDKSFMRESVTKSTKLSAGIGLSMGGSVLDFPPPVEGDPAFSNGLPLRATANGPGISFNGEMVKNYFRLTIRAQLRATVSVGKYTTLVVPR